MTLHDFLRQPRQFAWGGTDGEDCMTLCASWILVSTGVDVAGRLRGLYRDASGAERIVRRSGGLVKLAGNLLETHGFQRTANPTDGDVGIVIAPAGFTAADAALKEIAAIRFGTLWVAMGPGGVIGKRAERVAAWKIHR